MCLTLASQILRFFCLYCKVASTLEQGIFTLDTDNYCTTENMETLNGDVQQTTCTSTHIEPFNQDKEVQVQTNIKTFKTVGT